MYPMEAYISNAGGLARRTTLLEHADAVQVQAGGGGPSDPKTRS